MEFSKTDSLLSRLQMTEIKIIASISSEGMTIDIYDKILISVNGKQLSIADTLKLPVFVFCYSELNCRGCIFDEFDHISKIIPGINVVLLSHYNSEHEFIIERPSVDLPRFNTSVFDWPVAKLAVPYYFVMEKNGRASRFFIPDPQNPELSKKYLQMIKQQMSTPGDK